MHISSSYAPPGESATVLWTERSIMIGKALSCIPYGMLLLLYVQCADVLIYKKYLRNTRFSNWALFTYTTFIFVLATIALGLGLKWGEMIFIDNRNYPGGPSAFYTAFYSYWVPLASNSCFVALNLCADALLLYRYFVVWDRKWSLLALPMLLFIAAIAVSVSFMVLTGRSDSGFVPVGLTYWSLTIFFNIIITILIAGRLWMIERKMHLDFGDLPGGVYGRISAILIESQALYSALGLLQVIAYARDYNGLRRLFQGALGQTQCVATFLVVRRMGQGRAYSSPSSESQSRPPSMDQQVAYQARRPVVDVSGLVTEIQTGTREADPSSATTETPLTSAYDNINWSRSV